MRFLRGFLWLEWIYLGLNGNRFWFLSFKEIPYILDCQIKYDAFLTKPSRRFYESPEGLTSESAVLQFFFFLG
jgi:hypothetical protein